jgi:hypothetical protein
MTALEARLLAGRAVRAAQAQENFARRLRPVVVLPTQRAADEDAAVIDLSVVAGLRA